MLDLDIFNVMSTAATILSTYAAWKTYKTSKDIQGLQELKIAVEVKEVVYEKVPDTHWHTLTLVLINESTLPVNIKKMTILTHGRSYKLNMDESHIIQPFTKEVIACSFGSGGTDIMDGRYPATLSIETDRKTVECNISENEFRAVFRSVPSHY